MESDANIYVPGSLRELLVRMIPPLAEIQTALERAPVAELLELLQEDATGPFIIDYYFRLFPPAVGARFINHPDFSIEQLEDLFSCQIVRFYRRHAMRDEMIPEISLLLDSYWALTTRDRLLELFKRLLANGQKGFVYLAVFLQKLDKDDLSALVTSKGIHSRALLRMVKDLGSSIGDVIASNIELFDYVFRLATELQDNEYLMFLEEYTILTVQLRIASSVLDDIRAGGWQEGQTVPVQQLLANLKDVPLDSLDITLNLLAQKGMIDKSGRETLAQFLKESREN